VTLLCSTVKMALDTVGDAAITGPLATHVESCAACAAELEVFESVASDLGTLARNEFSARPDLQANVMDALGPVALPDWEEPPSKTVPIAAAVATAAVATAAAGTVVIIRLRRSRAA